MEIVQFIPPSQRKLTLLAAQTDSAPVLIFGGSGTGKGAIARWIHNNGPRSGNPLIELNRDRPLADEFKRAQGGTLMIPEVGLLSLKEQAILLRVLTHRSLVDSSGVAQLVNIRVIALTSQALEGRAQTHLFNPDLLEKLNVFRLEMPPLSKRAAEFEDISSGILAEIVRELRKDHVRGLAPAALAALQTYDWPGNLRELRNVLRIAAIAAPGDRVERSDLPEFGHEKMNFRATREEFEKTYILELLKTFQYDIDRTCQMSHMDKPTLMEKIKKYGIALDRERTVP